MAITFTGSAEHSRAIHWASADLDVSELELVSNSTWAVTYRLYGAAQTRYLKILPGASRQRVSRLVEVAKLLPGQVPEVIRAASDEGWVLFANFDGQKLSRDDDVEEMIAVARDFGSIQAEASRSTGFLARMEQVDLAPVREKLLDFLAAPPAVPGQPLVKASAADFIGKAAAARFFALLQSRLPLLDTVLAAAAQLPTTLCHGDLHAQNVIHLPDGKTAFFDWDDASAGPAGLCLHGIFGGCALPAILAQRSLTQGSAGDSAQGRRLDAYVEALVKGGYASRTQLLESLPGSMATGQMRFITSFGSFPGEKERAAAAETIVDRLNDLLDLCDWFAAKHPEGVLAWADDYENAGEWKRAYRLVQDMVAREPTQVLLLPRLCHLAYKVGDAETAEEAAREAYAAAPNDMDAQLAMAHVCLAKLDQEAGTAYVAGVLARQPLHPRALELQSRFERVAAIRKHAAEPQNFPRVVLSASEHEAARLDPETQAVIVELFKTYGVLQVDNMFDPEHILRLQKAFYAKYNEHFYDGDHPHALKVGDKRYMLSMELDENFGAEELVASDMVVPVMREILSKECILGAYTAVVSLPGSEDQPIHKDHPALFEEVGWQFHHPTYGAQVVIPLLEMNEMTGATRVLKRTQQVPLHDSEGLAHQDPVVPLGSVIFLDYATTHYGIGNRSGLVRPILNLVYSRPWFRDYRNYHIQPPMRMPENYLQEASANVNQLFGWWELERKVSKL